MTRLRLAVLLLLAPLCLSAASFAADPPPGEVSGEGGIALEFDTSARSAGMGGATVAAPWGEGPGVWANPAMIGFHKGLRYESFESQLVPGFADDIEIHDEHITLGVHGLGFYLGRGPVPGMKLDMGTQPVGGGEPSDTIEPWMKSESYGIGLSVGDFVRHHLGDKMRPWARNIELAIGWMHKSYEEKLIWMLEPEPVKGDAGLHDIGLLAGYRFVDSIGDPDGFFAAGGGLRLTGTYGRSWLNHGDRFIGLEGDGFRVAPRMHVEGWAVRAETGVPGDLREQLENSGRGWIAESLRPLLAITYCDQTSTPGYRYDETDARYVFEQDDDAESTGWGLEIGFANILHVRRGHVKTPGDIDGDTDGWGLQLPLAGIGGFRYDEAEVPQAPGLGDVTRESWSVWLDVMGLRERLRN